MKQRMKRWMAVLSVFVLVLQLGGGLVHAETISGSKGNLSITSDASYVYFTYEGSWSSYVSEKIQASAGGTNLGVLGTISISMNADKESGDVTVGNAWSGSISGASGSFTCSDKKESYGYNNLKWSVKIPVSAYDSFDVNQVTYSWNGGSATVTVKEEVTEATTEVTSEEISEESSEATEENSETMTETTTEATGENSETTTEATTEEEIKITTEAATGEDPSITTEEFGDVDIDIDDDLVVTGNVTIDGMYDDWEDIPKTSLKYDDYTSHYGQMFTDGEYIYAHFKAGDNYTDVINMGLWYITINDKQFTLRILPASNGVVSSPDSPWKPGVYTNMKVFFEYENNKECDSNVVYTIYEKSGSQKKGDDIEFSFSLEKLSEYTGIPVDQMGTITLRNPNLGDKGVTIAGSSTGPVVGVMVAFILALAFFKKKKEMRNV